MRNELMRNLSLEDLEGNARELAELIGMEGFIRVVEVYGGSSNLYIPKAEQLVRPLRDDCIRREFNGSNMSQLARKWGLTERYIREILKNNIRGFYGKTHDQQRGMQRLRPLRDCVPQEDTQGVADDEQQSGLFRR